MYDFTASFDTKHRNATALQRVIGRRRSFFMFKRGFDLIISLLLLPLMLICAIGLMLLNPFCNRGPLMFVQTRMGQNCEPFRAIKFRSMRPESNVTRDAIGPLEHDRITPLGRIIRKMRLDELPQLINVLRGEMSLIGPRPDEYNHALHYLHEIPDYRERYIVRPGISGLAQTELGYAEGIMATRRKVQVDLYYIAKTDLKLDAWIFWRTLLVVIKRSGA